MNKVFKVIWNHALERFDVTSELAKSGKKNKSELNQKGELTRNVFKLSSMALTLLMTFTSNTALAIQPESSDKDKGHMLLSSPTSATTCNRDTLVCEFAPVWDYSTANIWGDAVVIDDGKHYVINGPSSVVATSAGTTRMFISDAIDKGYVTSATVNGAQINPTELDAHDLMLLDFGAKNNTFIVTDSTGVTSSVTTYTPKALQELDRQTQLLATVIDKDLQSAMFYQAGILKVTKGAADFNLNVPVIQNVYTKDTQLAVADGSGTDSAEIIWSSKNTIRQAAGVTAGDVPITASFSRYQTLTAFDGSVHAIINKDDLITYNQWLIDNIKSGQLKASLYDNELKKAYSQNTITYIVDTSGNHSDPTMNAPVGSFAALYGKGPKATVRLHGELSGTALNNTEGKNALILLDDGAQGYVDKEAKLTHLGGYGYAVSVRGGSNFINEGTIQDAGTSVTYLAYIGGSNSQLINKGTINYSPASVYSSNYGIGVMLKEGLLTNDTDGIINFSYGSYDNPGRIIGIDSTGSGIGGYMVNNGIITLGLMPVGHDVESAASVNTTIESRILNIGTAKLTGESQNNGTLILGEKTEGTYAVYINQANDAGLEKKVFVNTATGVIDILGAKSESAASNFGIFATNSAKKIENAGTINVKGTNNIGIKAQSAAQVTSSGIINVAGKQTSNKLNNFGVWVEGNNSLVEVSGLINLTGENTIGIYAKDRGAINLTGNGQVTFADGENQLGYYIYGAGSKINNTSNGSQDVTTKNSTLMRLDGGASFTGSASSTSTMTASGERAKVIVATGVGTTVNSGEMSINVSGKNASGFVIEGGATGNISNNANINLTGQGAIAGIADGQGHSLDGNNRTTSVAEKQATRLNAGATLNSSLSDVVGYIAKNLATINNSGDITFTGDNAVGIQVEEGATGINSGNITLGDNGTGLVAIAENLATKLTSTGNLILNGEGAIGISATGVKVVVDMKSDGISTPTIALNGNGAAGVKAAGGSTINLDDKVVTQFSTTATDQTAFWVSGKANDGTSSKINVAATTNPYDASGEKSTLFYVDDGASLNGALKINVSGKQASGIKVSDVGTKAVIDSGSQITVSGENATGIRATNGGEAEIKAGAAFIISGSGATIGLAEDLGSQMTNAAAVISAAGSSGSTAFIARNNGELNNTGNIDLSNGSDHIAISVNNGKVTNSGNIKASGTAIYIEGENSVINNTGTISATNGKAAIELGLNASLNLAALAGNGTITAQGTADGILLSQGAKGLNVSNTIIDMSDASSTGVGIHNKADIGGIKLDNTTIKVNNGVGIYTGASLDRVNSGLIEVAGGVGILYQDIDGGSTAKDLDLSGSDGLDINISAANGRGIVANLDGNDRTVNTSANVQINHIDGGAALDLQGVTSLIQSGHLSSLTGDVVKAGNATSIDNSGQIKAGDRTQNLIVMDAGSNKKLINSGMLVGQLNFVGGTNNVQLNDGSLIDGDIKLGNGSGNQLSLRGANNQLTGNVSATGSDTQISLSDSAQITGNLQLAAGQNHLDLQDNGQLLGHVSVGEGNNAITLADSAKISGSITVGAGNNNLMLSGQSQIGSFTAADGGENQVTVKDRATFGQLNAGLGGENDSLTFDNVLYRLANAQDIQHFDRINLTNGSAFTTDRQIQMGDSPSSSGRIAIDENSSLILNATTAYTLNHKLSGNGLINVTSASQFDFGSESGNQFAGTVAMNSNHFELSGFNTSALTKAILDVQSRNTTQVGEGNQTIGGLTLSGGTLDFGLYMPGSVDSKGFIDINGTLDISKTGQIKVNKSAFENTDIPVADQSLALLDQQNPTLIQLASANRVLTGGAVSLVDQNGDAISNARQDTVTQHGIDAALASYDYRVVTDGENGLGLYVGYGLSQLDLLSTGTDKLRIDVTNGVSRSLTAKVTGSGDLGISAGHDNNQLVISNQNNDYTGNTDLQSGTVVLGSDNALGQTHTLTLGNDTIADINGHQQTMIQLNGAGGSTLNLNGGSLTLTNGGLSAGDLTGNGQLNLNGGRLTIAKANADLTANTLVNNAAEVVLNHVDGLGKGHIVANGKVKLNNADGAFVNALSGNGELNIYAGSDVVLNGNNNEFAGVINIDSASTLTLGNSQSVGNTAEINNANKLTVNNDSAMTLSTLINGNGDLIKTKTGTLTLGGNNTYSGKTQIKEGVVGISADQNLGDGSATNLTVLDGGDLRITADLISGRDVTLSKSGSVIVDAGVTASMNGWSDQNNINNTIIKSGDGTLVWTGNNTANTADVTVNAGILQIDSLSHLASATGSVNLMRDGTLLIQKETAANQDFTRKLTGQGSLDVNLGAKDQQFSFGTSAIGNEFSGLLSMDNGQFVLDDNAAQIMANATLQINGDGSNLGSTKLTGNKKIGGLTLNGGRLDVDYSTANNRPTGHLTVDKLDAAGGGSLAISSPFNLPNSGVAGGTSFFDQDDNANDQIVAATQVKGIGTQLALTSADGTPVATDEVIAINDNGSHIGNAHYNYLATVKNDGLYIGHGLTELDAFLGQSIILDNTGALDNSLGAKLTGDGGFTINATGSVGIGNTQNDYQGMTDLNSGNLVLITDHSLGHTSGLNMLAGTSLDLNGNIQTVGSLHSEANSQIDLNHGELTVANGGTLSGILTGEGGLVLEANVLELHANSSLFSGTTEIQQGATAYLTKPQGLGQGVINNQGQLSLVGAKGTLLNNLKGEYGNVSLVNNAVMALGGDNSDFSGSFTIERDNTLLAGEASHLGAASVANEGQLTLDNSGLWKLTNQISGSGTLTKRGTGTVQLDSESQVSASLTDIENGLLLVGGDPLLPANLTSNVNVHKDGALGGYGVVIGDVTNSGNLIVGNSATGNGQGTFTIEGNYIGNNGTIVINADLADDASSTDKLAITGDTAGQSFIAVTSAHGNGAQTSNGIKLIDVAGLSNGDFTLKGRAVAGAYEYFLYKGGIATPDDGDWYLRSSQAPSPSPAQSIYRPEAGSYMANMAAASKLFNLRLEDRNGRAEDSSMWLRQQGSRTKFGESSGQLDTATNSYVIQGGGEVFATQLTEGDRLGLGVMLAYGQADSKTGSGLSGYNSKGNVDGYSTGVYATWYQNSNTLNGLYVDSWAQYSWLDAQVSGDEIANERYAINGFSTSLEAGYRIPAYYGENGDVYITPQAQIIWSGIKADDHTETNKTRVQSTGNNNVQTRLGLKLSRDGVSDKDKGQDRLFTTYVEANWLHNTENAGATMDGVNIKQSGNTNIAELKLGVEGDLNKNASVWSNVAQQLGDNGYNEAALTVGFKYKF